jgi:hypothetical protein
MHQALLRPSSDTQNMHLAQSDEPLKPFDTIGELQAEKPIAQPIRRATSYLQAL